MATHQDQPVYHLYDPNGWVNDPNGPLYYKGKYHMFFQNVTDSTKWTWGLSWGHATSTDLLHWRQLPAALMPDPGWHDADGCFSGCATVDMEGVPAILYTGVAKKPDAGEREGMPLTVNKLCYERQLLARPVDPDDPDLKQWTKVAEPFLPDHLAQLPINCFRDPFILDKPSAGNDWRWRIMVGSNIDVGELLQQLEQQGAAGVDSDAVAAAAAAVAAVGGDADAVCQLGVTLGTATVYRSRTKDLEGGWDYDGLLCVAKPGEGAIWECPILAPLTPPAAAALEQDGPAANRENSPAAAAAPAQQQGSIAVQGTPPSSPAVPPPPPSSPADAAAAAAVPLRGAVAAIAEAKQQQQQVAAAALDVERAMSGCLGLWTEEGGTVASSSSSSSTGREAPAAAGQQQSSSNDTSTSTSTTSSGALGQQQQQQPLPPTHVFSVSCGVSPAIYWLGRYADGRFDLAAADGPHALDLGDVMYAPNLLEDALGRQVIWSWLQEHPSPISHDYAGCISLPRQLQLGIKRSKKPRRTTNLNGQPQDHRHHHQQQQQQQEQEQGPDGGGDDGGGSPTEYYLIQSPLPELERLRSGRGLRLRGIRLPPGSPWSVPSQVSASHVDLSLTVRSTPGAQRFQLLLGPLRQEGEQQLPGSTADAPIGATDTAPLASGTIVPNPAALGTTVLPATGPDLSRSTPPAGAPGIDVPAASGSLNFVPVAVPVTGAQAVPAPTAPTPAAAAATAAAEAFATAAALGLPRTLLQSPAAGAGFTEAGFSTPGSSPPFPGSPTGSGPGALAVLPRLPTATGANNGSSTSTSSTFNSLGALLPISNGGGGVGGAAATLSELHPFAAAAASGSSIDSAAAALAAASGGVDILPTAASGLSEQQHSAALAAAAAAEQVAHEHHQAAAITYEFGSSQLQVLVGPPGPLLKLLNQQQEELAAAPPPPAAATAGHQSSRPGTPSADALGFEPPSLPPAPSGALAASMEAAQSAGVRVLACQLRHLDPDEPLQMRLLLDYSIMELFLGTGEALTTRVYRGTPTARAAEVAMKKVAAHAAAEAESAHMSVSMSDSLADLGLLLYQQQQQSLGRAGSGRLMGVQAGSSSSVDNLSGLSGLSSPAEVASPRLGVTSSLTGVRPQAAAAAAVPGSAGSSSANSPSEVQRGARGGLMGASHAVPFSPATAASGSYVHYFSPHRSLSARVGGLKPAAALPTLAGIKELPGEQPGRTDTAAAAAAASSSEAGGGRSVGGSVGMQAANLFGLGATGRTATPAAGSSDSAAAASDGASKSHWERLHRHMNAGSAGTSSANEPAVTGSKGSSSLSSEAGSSSEDADKPGAAQPASRREPIKRDSFPGFSPHKPPVLGLAESGVGGLRGAGGTVTGGDEAGSAAGGSGQGSGSARDTGAKLASWFQKKISRSSSKGKTSKEEKEKGSSSSSSSSSSDVVVPATFGVPIPPPFAPSATAGPEAPPAAAAATAAAAAAATAPASSAAAFGHDDVKDAVPSGSEDQSSSSGSSASSSTGARDQKPLHKSGLQIKTSSKLSSLKPTVDTQVTGQAGTSSHAGPAAVPAAAAAGGGAGSSTGSMHQLVGLLGGTGTTAGSSTTSSPTSPAAAAAAAVRSPRSPRSFRHRTGGTGSGGSSPSFEGTKSPSRRNWRSAFVFTEKYDDEDEGSSIGAAFGASSGGAAVQGSWWGTALGGGLWKLRQQLQQGAAAAAGGADDVNVREYGLYAKVLAPGATLAAAGTGSGDVGGSLLSGAGSIQGVSSGLESVAPEGEQQHAAFALDRNKASAGTGAGASSGSMSAAANKQSGYVPGAMRELSLVALGGGGVVLRLEAYEMASMWDDVETC